MSISFIANCVPAICILGGLVSYWMGDTGFGTNLIIVAIILQVLWIIGKFFL